MSWLKSLQRLTGEMDKQLYLKGVLDVNRLTLPDFLCIGPPQCGTTWLHENLQRHPQLFLPEAKQTHYFDRYFNRSLRFYGKQFIQGRDRIKGEITPDYCVLTEGRVALIRALMPQVRLILIIRNPVDRAWSAARRIFSRLGPEVHDEIYYDFFKNDSYDYPGEYDEFMNRGDYSRILDRWQRHFTQQQMLVLRFEDIAENPKAFLRRVFQHIGVDEDIDWQQLVPNSRINANPEAEMPDRFRKFLTAQYQENLDRLASYAEALPRVTPDEREM